MGTVIKASYHPIIKELWQELLEDAKRARTRCSNACIPTRGADLLSHTEGTWFPEEVYQKICPHVLDARFPVLPCLVGYRLLQCRNSRKISFHAEARL